MKPAEDFNLLIVDDEEQIRETIKTHFELDDYAVQTAASGNEALEIVLKSHIDFIISDVRMPDGDGVFLLEKVREVKPDIPIIVMVTGFAEITREDAIKKGALDLINKPYSLADMEELVMDARKKIQR
jgi:DNA-binding NtrC family response regulator